MSRALDRPALAAPEAVAREVDGNFTIYDKARDSVTVLNESASEIWRLCDGRVGSAIVDELARRYAADPEQIRKDVESTLDELAASGLLVDTDPGA
jgi:Coenzyme PQQ synthesis protein D (PqqD)